MEVHIDCVTFICFSSLIIFSTLGCELHGSAY